MQGDGLGHGSRGPGRKYSSGRWQHIEELLAACAADVLKLEEDAAREGREAAAAEEELEARLRDSLGSPVHASAAFTSASPSSVPAATWTTAAAAAGARAALSSVASAGCAQSQAGEVRLTQARQSPGSPAAVLPLPRGHGEGREEEDAADDRSVALRLLETLVHDNTVMECNLRDYDTALNVVLEEIERLKAEESELQRASGHAEQLRELLARELDVREQLRDENEALSARNMHLKVALAAAAGPLSADHEEDSMALVEGLVHENGLLRGLLFGNLGGEVDGDSQQGEECEGRG